jgi:hypothetical protein
VTISELPVVDGRDLPDPHRRLLRPGELMTARDGRVHRLPRFFYAIESASVAGKTQLTAHFALWEFIEVDLREPALLRAYPRYVPCAVTLMAGALELLRVEAGAPVRIAANGGYRSPAHAQSISGSPHCWATAVNIYSIGNDYLDTDDRISRYREMASRILSTAWIRPYGAEPGQADDHLHLDLGYATVVPAGVDERER